MSKRPRATGSFLCRPLALLCALTLLALPLSAQGPTLEAGLSQVFLTDGDHMGQEYLLGLRGPLSDRIGLGASAALARSFRTDFNAVADVEWRRRTFLTLDLGLRADLLRIEGSALRHDLGVAAGWGVRLRRQERQFWAFFPGAYQHVPEATDSLLALLAYDHYYLFQHDDGPGGLDDGQYGMLTRDDRGADTGPVGTLYYRASTQRLSVGAEFGLQYWSAAALVWRWGLRVGYRPGDG